MYQCKGGSLIISKARTTPSPFHFPFGVETLAEKAGAGLVEGFLATAAELPTHPQNRDQGAQK